MLKKLPVTLLLLTSMTACAKSPEAAVKGKPDPVGGNQPVVGQPIKTNAIHFKGKTGSAPFERECGFFLTYHDNTWMLKLDYTIHNQAIASTTLAEYDYDSNNRTFNKMDPAKGISGSPVLAAASMKDPNKTADLNKLRDHILVDKDIKNFYQINLTGNMTFAEFEAFEDAVKAVEADPTQFAANQAVFSAINGSSLIVDHGGHYDPSDCSGVSAMDVDEVTFDLDADDDHDHGDDHDHDHGDDHDHDHGDDHDHDHGDDHGDDDHDHGDDDHGDDDHDHGDDDHDHGDDDHDHDDHN